VFVIEIWNGTAWCWSVPTTLAVSGGMVTITPVAGVFSASGGG
jgi:hypothetical protein